MTELFSIVYNSVRKMTRLPALFIFIFIFKEFITCIRISDEVLSIFRKLQLWHEFPTAMNTIDLSQVIA